MLSRRSSPLVYFSHLRSPARQKERRTCHSEGQVEISARFCNPDNKKATFVSEVKPPVLTLFPPPPPPTPQKGQVSNISHAVH